MNRRLQTRNAERKGHRERVLLKAKSEAAREAVRKLRAAVLASGEVDMDGLCELRVLLLDAMAKLKAFQDAGGVPAVRGYHLGVREGRVFLLERVEPA